MVKKLNMFGSSTITIRDYNRELNLEESCECCIYDIEEFNLIKGIVCTSQNGYGFYVKDGLISNDEVLSSMPLDATHVIWYNTNLIFYEN